MHRVREVVGEVGVVVAGEIVVANVAYHPVSRDVVGRRVHLQGLCLPAARVQDPPSRVGVDLTEDVVPLGVVGVVT